jgi:hypothetical protein
LVHTPEFRIGYHSTFVRHEVCLLANSSTMRKIAVFLCPCSVSLLVACGPSFYAQQVQNAQAAEQRGDVATAAASWDAACRAEPSEAEACQRARATGDQLRDASIANAKAPCSRGEIDVCVSSLADVRRVRPQDQAVHAVLLQGSILWRTRCEKLERPGSLDSVLARLDCVEKKQAMVNDADYATMVREERDHAALLFMQANATLPAARYAQHGTAVCLSSRRSNRRAAEDAARDFLNSAARTIALRTQAGGRSSSLASEAQPSCQAIANALGPKARCVGAPPTPNMVVDVLTSIGDVQHSVTEEVRVARYRSGVQRDLNPQRHTAEMQASRSERAFNEIEQETMDRKADCQRTRSQYACDRYNAAVPVYNRRVEERDEARNTLNQTPAILEVPIYTEVAYKIRHHSWRLPYSVDVKVMTGKSDHYQGELSNQDDEHPSVPQADVPVDALEAPRFEEFGGKVRARSVGMATALLEQSFRELATCNDSPWTFDSPELECKLRSALYTTQTLPQPSLWVRSSKCE